MTDNAATLRAAAAVSTQAALGWLQRGGPDGYALAESLGHLAQATQLANAAADAAELALNGNAWPEATARRLTTRDGHSPR
jgi:hypothetical protein